jgi:hypothetical protein
MGRQHKESQSKRILLGNGMIEKKSIMAIRNPKTNPGTLCQHYLMTHPGFQNAATIA